MPGQPRRLNIQTKFNTDGACRPVEGLSNEKPGVAGATKPARHAAQRNCKGAEYHHKPQAVSVPSGAGTQRQGTVVTPSNSGAGTQRHSGKKNVKQKLNWE